MIAKGRTETALDILRTASEVNKVKLSPEMFASDPENIKTEIMDATDVPQYGVLDIFKK